MTKAVIANGIGEAIHTLTGEASFVAGFGVGTYAAVRIRRLLEKKNGAVGERNEQRL